MLALGGLALLFAPDVLLSRLIPGYPSSGLWLGQLLGAAWLGLACMNWLNRTALLGGIYARAVVGANAVCYFVGATSLLKAATMPNQSGLLWLLAGPISLLAAVYAWLLFRGPIGRDFAVYSQALPPRHEA